MNKARWIWLKGEYELFHNILLHSRREKNSVCYPSFWGLAPVYPRVSFRTEFFAERDTVVKVYANGDGMVEIDWKDYPLCEDIPVKAGKHSISVNIINNGGLPAVYINNEFLVTDNNWTATETKSSSSPVGDKPEYYNETDNVEIFPFEYKRLEAVGSEQINGGTVYDFGRELFGKIVIENADESDELFICYGESKPEAYDSEFAEIKQTVTGAVRHVLRSRAFRYIFVKCDNDNIKISAEYEYLPIEDKGSFSCDRKRIAQIYEMCSHTLHLNSREFYLDGIKRDRWVWAGDVYQTAMFNYYLYFEPEIIKRSILALFGKPPYKEHINTINDYSLYLIMMSYDYYNATGDLYFLRFIYPNLCSLYDFVTSRLDERGLMVERKNDWIFIDWSEMDKDGPLCAEQILLRQTHMSMYKISSLCGEDKPELLEKMKSLEQHIETLFWNEQKGAYIDTYASGKNNVTRHANIFAILFGLADEARMKSITENVLQNDSVEQITTPYFKFYELCALCKLGYIEQVQEYIEAYWGGMLDNGATCVWEQYNPAQSGAQHYEMYGARYGKSLCHAWGCGPLYLIGRFILGVRSTATAYKTFEIKPYAGLYKSMTGRVPVFGGYVDVAYKNGEYSVTASIDGGTLIIGSREYTLKAGVTVKAR